MKASNLREEGLRYVAHLLRPEGWERVGRQPVFSKQSAPKILSRLNFNCVLRNRPVSVHVTPYAEIVHSDVENIRRVITGKRLYTINSQIQILMSDAGAFWRWIFAEGKSVEPIAENLVNDSLSYGVPFIEQFRTLKEITAGLEALANGHAIMRESLAICYCLNGMLEKAAEVLIDDVEAAKLDPSHPARDQLRKYGELFGLTFSF